MFGHVVFNYIFPSNTMLKIQTFPSLSSLSLLEACCSSDLVHSHAAAARSFEGVSANSANYLA